MNAPLPPHGGYESYLLPPTLAIMTPSLSTRRPLDFPRACPLIFDSENRKPPLSYPKAPFQTKRPQPNKYRAGDWICNRCHNHNYSFRSVCNSCKTQTKADNLLQSLGASQDEAVVGGSASATTQSPGESPEVTTKKRKLGRLNPNNYFKPSVDGAQRCSAAFTQISFGNACPWQAFLGSPQSPGCPGQEPDTSDTLPSGPDSQPDKCRDSDSSFDFDQDALDFCCEESESE